MGSLVSLVMSDIVDSTRRWNAAEGAMAADLELHDRLIRDVVEGAGGSVFKHTGDGMIAVFDDPVAAAGAAAGIQQAIGGAQWQHPDGLRVRAAVHTGVVYPRDGDLFGTAVNKVARLLGACPAGAVLVSGATTALLADRAPEGLRLDPVGPIDLAGFATPDDAHALVGDGVAEVAAVAPAIDLVQQTAIPSIDDELVGRSDELAIIWEALGRTRVVTLVGAGGMGKTRLALEIASGGMAAYNGAVWWIDLANATSADAVVPVTMAAVGARDTSGRTPLQAILERLAGVSGLIVVDNCEHVLAASRELVAAMRNGAPDVRVVCTSREALGLRGEQIIPIGSLSTDDGVALFGERARAVLPDIDLVDDAAVIQRICARLDGIPLAIELAAARCRSMTPAEIEELLDDRFRLLRGGREGAERHRTLQATVAWSYSLLDPDERAMFDQMAVFAGGTFIDGLVTVTGFDRLDALDVVDRLVARSMLVATRTPLGTRYHQLETLRQYAEDRLVDAGSIDAARNRHLAWICEFAEWFADCAGTPRAGDAFRRFCVEVDNLRVAVAHATATGQHHRAHEVVALLHVAARSRPVYEMFDWIRPLQVGDGWTDAAAVCAAAGAYADFLRGGRLDDGPIGGVPEHFLTSNPTVIQQSCILQSFLPGRWRVALDRLETRSGTFDSMPGAFDRAWLMIQYNRQLYGGPADVITPDELVEIHRRGHAAVDASRRCGDELAHCSQLVALCLALEYSHPEEVLDLSSELLVTSERLGARSLYEFALSRYHRCLAYLVARGGVVGPEATRSLRNAIVEALDRGSPATSLAFSAVAQLAPSEPSAILILMSVYRRYTGVDVAGFLTRADVPVPDDWSEYERQAAGMSLTDAIWFVVAALDRAIAAAEAQAAAGGDG